MASSKDSLEMNNIGLRNAGLARGGSIKLSVILSNCVRIIKVAFTEPQIVRAVCFRLNPNAKAEVPLVLALAAFFQRF